MFCTVLCIYLCCNRSSITICLLQFPMKYSACRPLLKLFYLQSALLGTRVLTKSYITAVSGIKRGYFYYASKATAFQRAWIEEAQKIRRKNQKTGLWNREGVTNPYGKQNVAKPWYRKMLQLFLFKVSQQTAVTDQRPHVVPTTPRSPPG